MLGLFDSGVGGLTVVRELLKRAPRASFVYLGDTARTPYGNKTAEVIERYALEDAGFLVREGATDIAVACNTASTVLGALKRSYPKVRFFDVITPAVNAASEMDARKIGVIGTRATIQSGIYEQRLKERNPVRTVLSVACPLFVPLVEENWINRPETKRIARTYLAALRQKQVDALILGCTHYPLLRHVIRAALQKRVKIVDSPSALLDVIGREAPQLLAESDRPRQTYFFTDVSPVTDAIASRWLNRPVKGELAVL